MTETNRKAVEDRSRFSIVLGMLGRRRFDKIGAKRKEVLSRLIRNVRENPNDDTLRPHARVRLEQLEFVEGQESRLLRLIMSALAIDTAILFSAWLTGEWFPILVITACVLLVPFIGFSLTGAIYYIWYLEEKYILPRTNFNNNISTSLRYALERTENREMNNETTD